MSLSAIGIQGALTGDNAVESPSTNLLGNTVDPNDSAHVHCRVEIDPTSLGGRALELWQMQDSLSGGNGSVPETPPSGLNFGFVNLEDGFTEVVSGNYSETDIVGRAEAYKTFISSTNRMVDLSFEFQVQFGDCVAEVVYPARWLDRLKEPLYDASTEISHAPPAVLLTIGDLLTCRCVLQDASLQWRGPFEPGDMYPHGARVDCQFHIVRRLGTGPSGLGKFHRLPFTAPGG